MVATAIQSIFDAHLQSKTDQLLRNLAEGCSNPQGLGSMSTNPYDTAWVSMVSKEEENKSRRQWAFYSSFTNLLSTQSPNGQWGSETSHVDAILCTMAGLLALKTHQSHPEWTSTNTSTPSSKDLDDAVQRAVSFLTSKLQTWDVENTDSVGFEILIPTHMRLLEEYGISFTFPGLPVLMRLNQSKLSKFSPSILYSHVPTTLIHSLEAFIGQIDFDRVTHRLDPGSKSMMASPSSTAAYLIHASKWDDEAETWMRSVIELGVGKGSGAVPCSFPITIFEMTWVTTALLESGLTLTKENSTYLATVADYLEKQMAAQNGLVGFAPTMMADLDDTAKSISVLSLLNRPVSPARMIEGFKNKTHFRVYPGERNPSFSANCNALSAMLHVKSPEQYLPEIEMVVKFLCDRYTSGETQDKWNTCPIYSRMLFAYALGLMLRLWANNGPLTALSKDLLDRARIVFCNLLAKTLSEHMPDGSWHNQSPEMTAYAVLTLAAGSNSFLAGLFGNKLQESIIYGRAFLQANMNRWDCGENIWIDKTCYSSSVLSTAYCVAAIQAPTFTWTGHGKQDHDDLANVPIKEVNKMTQFYARLPMLSNTPEWRIRAALVEGYLWLPRLIDSRLDVIPRETKGDCIKVTAHTSLLINALNGDALEPDQLWELMYLSIVLYKLDEFVEVSVGTHLLSQIHHVRAMVDRQFDENISGRSRKRPFADIDDDGDSDARKKGAREPEPQPPTSSKQWLEYFEIILNRFFSYIFTHPAVVRAPVPSQRAIRRALRSYLHSAISQEEESASLRAQDRKQNNDNSAGGGPFLYANPKISYHTWAHTIGCDHSLSPLTFQIYSCLIAKTPGQATFRGPREIYLAEDMIRHLGISFRQFNDWGGMARDLTDGTLNSVNFPEFYDDESANTNTNQTQRSEKEIQHDLKTNLLWLAEYEQESCVAVLERLGKVSGMPERTVRQLKVYIGLSTLVAQIYVAKDFKAPVR